MKLPEVIWIMGFKFIVKEMQNIDETYTDEPIVYLDQSNSEEIYEDIEENDEVLYGMLFKKRLEIHIKKDVDDQVKLQTLYHEIQHAINHLCYVEGNANKERNIDLQATSWMQIIVNNPELVKLAQKIFK